MQKKESFYAEVQFIQTTGWLPSPRECSTLVANGNAVFLFGGMNHDTSKELARITMSSGGGCGANPVFSEWKNINYETVEKQIGRSRHTSCMFNNKNYIFGGHFMYNMKR